jgi:hypothetical protein
MTSALPPPDQLALLADDDRGPILLGVSWILASMATTFLSLRIYCKVVVTGRLLWWDDWILIGGWVRSATPLTFSNRTYRRTSRLLTGTVCHRRHKHPNHRSRQRVQAWSTQSRPRRLQHRQIPHHSQQSRHCHNNGHSVDQDGLCSNSTKTHHGCRQALRLVNHHHAYHLRCCQRHGPLDPMRTGGEDLESCRGGNLLGEWRWYQDLDCNGR